MTQSCEEKKELSLVFLLSSDNLFKPRLLYQLMIRHHFNTKAVIEVCSPPKTWHKKFKQLKRNLTFWKKGILWLALISIIKKVLSITPVPRVFKITCSLKNVCKLYDIPYHISSDINSEQTVEFIRSLKPDIIISFQHQIIKSELLKIPRIAAINCHPAELPKYRGVKPIFWAMLKGEKRIGVTVHTMTEKIDAGRIVTQECFYPPQNATLFENYAAAYEIASSVIDKAILIIKDNNISSLPLIKDDSPYYRFPSKNSIKAFIQSGAKIF